MDTYCCPTYIPILSGILNFHGNHYLLSAIICKLEWWFPLFQYIQLVYPILWASKSIRAKETREDIGKPSEKEEYSHLHRIWWWKVGRRDTVAVSWFWEGSFKTKPTHRGGQSWDLEMNWVHRTLHKPLDRVKPEAWVILEPEDRWTDNSFH